MSQAKMSSNKGLYQPGQSGNPKGRPKGARNRLAASVDELMNANAKAIVEKAIEKAKEGDAAFVRLCLDRIVPPVKDKPVSFDLPDIDSAQDAAVAVGAVLRAVADGELTPIEAAEVSKIVNTYVTALEASDLEQRIAKLEVR